MMSLAEVERAHHEPAHHHRELMRRCSCADSCRGALPGTFLIQHLLFCR